MNYIESVEIKGFWGDKSVRLMFKDDVNFLIGPNGSGKTTIINLISAVMRFDLETLLAFHFDEVFIKLKTIGGNTKPSIKLKKNPESPSGDLTYFISHKASDKPLVYRVDDFRGVWFEDIYRSSIDRHVTSRRVAHQRHLRSLGDFPIDIAKELESLIRVTWLSVHRSASVSNKDDESRIASDVDQKVRDISRSFANYFSLLTSTANRESRLFQETIFLSLLFKKRNTSKLFNTIIDVENERVQLEQIFSELGMAPSRFTSRIKQHFDAVDRAQDKLRDSGTGLELNEFAALMDSTRVHEVVDEWLLLQAKHSEIFAPKTRFEEVINQLFVRKRLVFNERNEPEIITQSGKKFGPSVLSSGEKQLFILFGEALLHENQPAIFIADEPELSLHVSWQAELIKNMRSLNPQAQMIIATHSPDIVGAFQNRVIKVEDFIS